MTLLHFRRTFVEKLFAIHGKVEQLKESGALLGRDVRHYADLYVLADRPEVTAMLASDEYDEIKADYDEKSRTFFPRSYRPPPDLCFGNSDALFPSGDLQGAIEPGYERSASVSSSVLIQGLGRYLSNSLRFATYSDCGRLTRADHPSHTQIAMMRCSSRPIGLS
jgi:hypothetical protein